MAFCPYIFVDNDSAMMRGLIQGFPKRLSAVHQTRTFAAPSLAAAPVAPGSRFAATASTAGQRIAHAEVKLTQKVDDPSRVGLGGRPIVNLRHFPHLAPASTTSRPSTNWSSRSWTTRKSWTCGPARASSHCPSPRAIADLAPVRVGAGFRLSMSYTVTDLKTLSGTTASE